MKIKLLLLALILSLSMACALEIGGVPAWSQPRGYSAIGITVSALDQSELAVLWLGIPTPNNPGGSTTIWHIGFFATSQRIVFRIDQQSWPPCRLFCSQVWTLGLP